MIKKIKKRSLNVTVYVEVYNEEHRLESCLKCFEWAKELIVFDKNSTDRTAEIARKYATKVVIVPKTTASENWRIWGGHLICDWTLSITASSLIHPGVVLQIEKYITDPQFDFDVIGLPYGMYAFGIRSEHSAWFTKNKLTLIRKNKLKISDELHKEISFASDRIFLIQAAQPEEVFYHLTHETLASFMDRITRYAEYEADWIYRTNEGKNRNKVLIESIRQLFKGMAILIIKRRFFMMGLDGWVMALAYLFNISCNTIFLWERYRKGNAGPDVYSNIRGKITNLWDDQFN